MQVQFLTGPAGSGKTFRCLAEIRAALRGNPAGPLLILLAPKQATFQLERQLLAGPSLSGYSRLRIFSFERLAQFILDELGATAPQFLRDEGRVMVLRALLLRHADALKLFRGSARRPGFAHELAGLMNELQQHQVTVGKLRSQAQNPALHRELREKLHDLALLLEAYAAWLNGHQLQDGNHLLEAATAALRGCDETSPLCFDHLWLDGFAEMTPQEQDLLAAILPSCRRATLAFCLDESDPELDEFSWLSVWSAVGKTFQDCRQRLEALPGCKISVESLPRDPARSRFAGSHELQRLEACWQTGAGVPPAKTDADRMAAPRSIQIGACANAQSEASLAAREILKFVHQPGNRFRDCAVLVRNLEAFHQPVTRALQRRGIPFFLDRRESVAHHPLAELTRGALRTAAFDWRQDDWFAALKAGFAPASEEEIDRLENESLARGWHGTKWLDPVSLPENAELEKSLERLRRSIIPPFAGFTKELARHKHYPNGIQLADALRQLWTGLKVESTLARWSLDGDKSAIHQTVWDQMNAWLDDLALAFPDSPLALRDWLPVLEAGLASLTVGVVPPALDQVLVGAIDRARNPDLKLALVLGVNETVFPASPVAPAILTDADRDELTLPLGPNLRERLARERYYGYIACTRSSGRLVVTYARQSADGKVLNPSPFIAHLQAIFPSLSVEEFRDETDWREAGHAGELVIPLMQFQNSVAAGATRLKASRNLPTTAGASNPWRELLNLPALKSLADSLAALREPDEKETLSPALAEKLYGPVLRSSVSRLEEFASCPFRYFVRSGLRADERKVFELDARERGSFQHEVLKLFHDSLAAQGKRWRDLTPGDAREHLAAIARELAQSSGYRDGLLRDSAQTQFETRVLISALQDFVEVIVSWMRSQYSFDPMAVELGFGVKEAPAPAWEIPLPGGRRLALQGRIDRVDLWRVPGGNEALAVVLDYKSGKKSLDKVLIENGVQLQLLAYLAAIRNWPADLWTRLNLPAGFPLSQTLSPLGQGGGIENGNPPAFKITPAGVFYLNLRGDYQGGGTRDEILDEAGESRRKAYRHTGRFDAGVLDQLDRIRARDQFSYQLKKDGSLYANSTEALTRAEFEKLLDGVEAQLRRLGERIFAGDAQVDPYRKGRQTPCEYCDYQAACRIDKWTHAYRPLRPAASRDSSAG